MILALSAVAMVFVMQTLTGLQKKGVSRQKQFLSILFPTKNKQL